MSFIRVDTGIKRVYFQDEYHDTSVHEWIVPPLIYNERNFGVLIYYTSVHEWIVPPLMYNEKKFWCFNILYISA